MWLSEAEGSPEQQAYGDMVGPVYNDQEVQVKVEVPDVLIVLDLGRCLFSLHQGAAGDGDHPTSLYRKQRAVG